MKLLVCLAAMLVVVLGAAPPVQADPVLSIGEVARADPPNQTQKGRDCWSRNCNGSGISTWRACYLCCAGSCMGQLLDGCQTACDERWLRTDMQEPFVRDAITIAMESRGDAAAQLAFLANENLWVELALNNDQVPLDIVRLADWFYLNGDTLGIRRFGLQTAAWLYMDYELAPDGFLHVHEMLIEAFYSGDPGMQSTAMTALRHTRAHLEDQRVFKAMMDVVHTSEMVAERIGRVLR